MSSTWPYRYFYDEKNQRVLIARQNPCGCHPCDLILQWGKKYNESASYSFKNDLEIEEFLGQWIEL